VSYDKSLPSSSYSDADADDELDFPPTVMSVKKSTVGVGGVKSASSALQCGRVSQLSRGGADCDSTDADSAAVSVCAPILVVPPSDSYISLIRTPDASPDFSPSQARCFQTVSEQTHRVKQ